MKMAASFVLRFNMHLLYNTNMEKKGLTRLKNGIEKILPMTLGNFLLFAIIVYLLFVVGRSVWISYQSNKDLDVERDKIAQLQNDIEILEMEIVYYKTQSFKEKEARAKLGYMAPGETAISLSVDRPEDKLSDQGRQEKELKTPNCQLWISYFFE